jgi:inward rectifier potassium channel
VSISKINKKAKDNQDTGFGVQASQLGERFVRKDGSFNLHKQGWPLWKRISLYSYILKLSWLQFLGAIILFYFIVNVLFTFLYCYAGFDQLTGLLSTTKWGRIKEVFFFSTQTFTTVGYGRINPIHQSTDIIASIQAMTGWLFFALVTGLLYGRFTQPKAYLAFSEKALVSPYKGGWGLMFRMVPYKENHYLTDARVVVNVAFMVVEEDKPVYKFYELKLERSRVDALSTNWTVVHPIDTDSPIVNFGKEDMDASDLELYVQVTGFDHIFSNTVLQRTSYTFPEIVWNAKFSPMYRESTNGQITIIELDKLNSYNLLISEESES